VLDLGKTVKEGLEKNGMIGWQFNTIGVCVSRAVYVSLAMHCGRLSAGSRFIGLGRHYYGESRYYPLLGKQTQLH
jgi:hypothetical protein